MPLEWSKMKNFGSPKPKMFHNASNNFHHLSTLADYSL